MTADHPDGPSGRPKCGPDGPFETHFEVTVDYEPEPQRDSVYVDVVARDHQRWPVIQTALRSANLKVSVYRAAGRTGHRLAYHAVRAPMYLTLAVFWSVVGVGRLAGRQARWWWLLEQHNLRQEAATRNDPPSRYMGAPGHPPPGVGQRPANRPPPELLAQTMTQSKAIARREAAATRRDTRKQDIAAARCHPRR